MIIKKKHSHSNTIRNIQFISDIKNDHKGRIEILKAYKEKRIDILCGNPRYALWFTQYSMIKFFQNIWLFLMVLLFIENATSQTTYDEKRFFLGIAVGPTACQVHGDNYSGYNKLGFMGGLLVHYKWFQNVIPQTGIVYIQKGSRHNPDSANLSQYLLQLHFIEIPTNIKFLFLKKKLFITLGHSVSYLFSYYEEVNYLNTTNLVKNEKFEFSINTGFGYQINDKINIELHANNGYTPFRRFAFPSNIFYNNPIARMFNKGLYNNILEIIFTYHLYGKNAE